MFIGSSGEKIHYIYVVIRRETGQEKKTTIYVVKLQQQLFFLRGGAAYFPARYFCVQVFKIQD
jgi:hypothetical protein